jgi:teichuronic acid exporter
VKKEVVSGIKWNTINQLFNLGSKFIVTVFLTRLLEPEDFGLIALVFTFTAFADNFTEGGFKNAIIQETDVNKKELSSIFFLYITVGLFFTILIACISPFLSYFYKQDLTVLTCIIALTYIINPLTFIHEALMQKELLFKQLALSQIISKTSSAIVGISLAYAGLGVWALVWSMHTGAIMRGLMLIYQYKWLPDWHFNKLDLKKYWKVGSNVFYSGLLFNFTNRIDYLIIGKFFVPASLGMYSRAKENGFLPALIFGNVIRSTFIGIYAKLKTDTEKLKEMFIDSSNTIFLMVATGCFLLTMFTEEGIYLLFGPKWLPMTGMMQLFFGYVFVYCLSVNRVYLLNAIGRTDVDFKLGLIFTPIRLILLLLPVLLGLSINPYYFIGVNILFLISGLIGFELSINKYFSQTNYPQWHFAPIALIYVLAIVLQQTNLLNINLGLLKKTLISTITLIIVVAMYHKSVVQTWNMIYRKKLA